jgi:hypothetical protein
MLNEEKIYKFTYVNDPFYSEFLLKQIFFYYNEDSAK